MLPFASNPSPPAPAPAAAQQQQKGGHFPHTAGGYKPALPTASPLFNGGHKIPDATFASALAAAAAASQSMPRAMAVAMPCGVGPPSMPLDVLDGGAPAPFAAEPADGEVADPT